VRARRVNSPGEFLNFNRRQKGYDTPNNSRNSNNDDENESIIGNKD